jgi:hypothetical protein
MEANYVYDDFDEIAEKEMEERHSPKIAHLDNK